MADAPASGGGSAWGTFEIVLVVILVGGLLMRLNGSTITTPTNDTVAEKPVVITKPTPTPREECGLTTTRPHSLEKVGNFVTVSGFVTGCNWVPTVDVALYAQIVDGYGKPVSEYIAVHPSPIQGASVPFTASIEIDHFVAPGTGFVILVPAVPVPGKSITARIPITFIGH